MKIALRLCRLLAAATLTGCALGLGGGTFPSEPPQPTPIEVSDHNVFLPSIRAGANFIREPGNEPSHAQGGHGIELTVSRASGSGAQSLGAGDMPVNFGSRSFA